MTVGSPLLVPGREPRSASPTPPGGERRSPRKQRAPPHHPPDRAEGPGAQLGRLARRPYLGSRGSAGLVAAAEAAGAAAAARAGVRGSPWRARRCARLGCAARFPGAGGDQADRGAARGRRRPSWKTPPLACLPPSLQPAWGLPSFLRLPGALARLGPRPTPPFCASASSGSGADTPSPPLGA